MKTILDAEKIVLNLFTYNPTHSSQKTFHAIVLECHGNSGTKETYFCWIKKIIGCTSRILRHICFCLKMIIFYDAMMSSL